jgi:hypothetical protein
MGSHLKKPVAVLGCGPAGLLAAHAAEQLGFYVRIYSKKRKSDIGGAQYLHDAIPGLTSERPDGELNYVKWGSREGYAARTYGSPEAPCSWDLFPTGLCPAWSLRRIYDQLWERFESDIFDQTINAKSVHDLEGNGWIVINSIPLMQLCEKQSDLLLGGFPPGHPEQTAHQFPAQRIWLANIDMRDGALGTPDNTIIYNGASVESIFSNPWYRVSRVFGQVWTEWSDHHPPREGGPAVEGFKPLHTDCDCHPDVIRVGRFGQWKKGVLVHHAYNDAKVALEALR